MLKIYIVLTLLVQVVLLLQLVAQAQHRKQQLLT